MHPQITTVEGAAQMLSLSAKTVLRHAAVSLPGTKVGRAYRFWTPALHAWSQGLTYADASADDEWSSVIALSITECAQAVALADETIRSLVNTEELTARRVGRYWRVSWPSLRDRIAGLS